MKIVCIGGGPAGLYFGLLMRKLGLEHGLQHDITVVERNKPYDTFWLGRGVLRRHHGQHAAVGPRVC